MVGEVWNVKGLGNDLSAEEHWLLFEKLIERLAVHIRSH